MNLNCKPGDLAVVVSACSQYHEFIGRIVQVQRLAERDEKLLPAWHTNPVLHKAGIIVYASDCCLRPLRWANRPDEMLLRAGKPVRERT